MRFGRAAVVTIVGLIVVSLVLPAIASGMLGGRLAPVLAEEFGVEAEDVTLDLALSPVWDLVRGRIGDVGVQIAGYGATAGEATVLIDPLGVALLDVRVDLGAALGDSLEQVDFAQGLVFARLPFEALTPVLRPSLQAQGVDLRGLASDGDGALLLLGAIEGVPGSDFTVRAVLEVVEDTVVLGDTEVVDGRQEVQVLVDNADLSIDVSNLPAGIVLTDAATDDEAVRVRGELPAPLVLAALR